MVEIPPSIIPKGKERLYRIIDTEYPLLTSVFHYTQYLPMITELLESLYESMLSLCSRYKSMKTKIIIIQILTTVHNAKTVFVYNNKQSASKSVNCRGSNISGGSNKR